MRGFADANRFVNVGSWLSLLGVLLSCTPHSDDPTSPSVSSLCERPEAFSGQTVSTSGFLLVSWEWGGAFGASADEQAYDTDRGVRLRIPTKTLGPLDRYDGTFGMTTGRFESDQSHGWCGTLTVDAIHPWYRFRPVLRPRKVETDRNPEDILMEQVQESLRRAYESETAGASAR